MTTIFNSKIAAVLLASAVLGGASASIAADNGDYYRGASKAPIVEGQGVNASGAVDDVKKGGDGEYYVGTSRQPVDTIATGSIVRDSQPAADVQTGGEGTYYRGISRQ